MRTPAWNVRHSWLGMFWRAWVHQPASMAPTGERGSGPAWRRALQQCLCAGAAGLDVQPLQRHQKLRGGSGQIQHHTLLAVRTNTPRASHGIETSAPILLNESGAAYADFTPLSSNPVCDVAETPAPLHALIVWLNTNYLRVIGEPLTEDVPMGGAAYGIGALEAVPEAFFMRYLVPRASGIFCCVNIRSGACV